MSRSSTTQSGVGLKIVSAPEKEEAPVTRCLALVLALVVIGSWMDHHTMLSSENVDEVDGVW
eukprot:scaffold4244_cov167-Amphora_coffeaeformis.AAC.30